MTRIYCKDCDLFTEQEARDMAQEIVDNNDNAICFLKRLPYTRIWDMLDEAEKEKINELVVEEVLEEEFTYRDFPDGAFH